MPDKAFSKSSNKQKGRIRFAGLLLPVNRNAGEFRDCWKDSLERSLVDVERVKAKGSLGEMKDRRERERERDREREGKGEFATPPQKSSFI